MGQSILKSTRNPFKAEHFIIISLSRKAPFRLKGNRVNIPEPGRGNGFGPVSAGYRSECGNANRLGDVSESPGKSCLFFVRHGLPGIGLAGERDVVAQKHRGSRGVRCTLVGP